MDTTEEDRRLTRAVILEAIQDHGSRTVEELGTQFNMSDGHVLDYLAELRRTGKIVKLSSARYGLPVVAATAANHAAPAIRVNVAALIVRRTPEAHEILLGHKSDGTAHAGLYVFPGGSINHGETFEEALCREIREKTSMDIEIDTLLGAYSLLPPPGITHNHHVIMVFGCRPVEKEGWDFGEYFVAGDDIDHLVWCSKARVFEMLQDARLTKFVIRVLGEFGWFNAPEQQDTINFGTVRE